MIKILEQPELHTVRQRNEKFDGHYVAVQLTADMYVQGTGYSIATSEITDDGYIALHNYLRGLREKGGMAGMVVEATCNSDDSESSPTTPWAPSEEKYIRQSYYRMLDDIYFFHKHLYEKEVYYRQIEEAEQAEAELEILRIRLAELESK